MDDDQEEARGPANMVSREIQARRDMVARLDSEQSRRLAGWIVDLARRAGLLIVQPELRVVHTAMCDIAGAALGLLRLPEAFALSLDRMGYGLTDGDEDFVESVLADDRILLQSLEGIRFVLKSLRTDEHRMEWSKSIEMGLHSFTDMVDHFVSSVPDDLVERAETGLNRVLREFLDSDEDRAKALLKRESEVWLKDLDGLRSRYRAFIRSKLKDEPYYAYSIREWDRLGLS